MPKTMAVMNGLEHIASALRERGIKVVDVADTGSSISAIIYSARVNPGQSAPAAGQAKRQTGGGVDDMVLMLNADELSVEEIVARVRGVW
jgi:hypothetical protein